MGIPHLGSSKTDLLSPLTRLSSLVRKTNREIVHLLEPGSAVLATLQQDFHTMIKDMKKNENKWIDMFCFYEEVAYTGVGEVRMAVPEPSELIAS